MHSSQSAFFSIVKRSRLFVYKSSKHNLRPNAFFYTVVMIYITLVTTIILFHIDTSRTSRLWYLKNVINWLAFAVVIWTFWIDLSMIGVFILFSPLSVFLCCNHRYFIFSPCSLLHLSRLNFLKFFTLNLAAICVTTISNRTGQNIRIRRTEPNPIWKVIPNPNWNWLNLNKFWYLHNWNRTRFQPKYFGYPNISEIDLYT